MAQFRPNANRIPGGGTVNPSFYAEENQRLENDLNDKVKALKDISINIGTEVRHQNAMLNDMDSDTNSLQNLLSGSMTRLKKLAGRSGGCKNWCMIGGFVFATFFVMYFILR